MRTEAQRLQEIKRDLHDLARPYVALKCDILAVNAPTVCLSPDGKIVYSSEVTSQLEAVDKLWDEARQAYFQRREDFGPNGDATTPGFFREKL